jgi:prophage maintenance system killer protein
MSTNPHIVVPAAIDAEEALGIWVADEPIGEALLLAADLVEDGEQDVAIVAAAAFWWVARERPLSDGNKRAALAIADLILSANDRHLGGAEEELVQLAARTAAGIVDQDWVDDKVARLAAIGAPEEFFLEREQEVVRRLAEDEYVLPEPPRSPTAERFATRLSRFRARGSAARARVRA